jgi:hypothetical protein
MTITEWKKLFLFNLISVTPNRIFWTPDIYVLTNFMEIRLPHVANGIILLTKALQPKQYALTKTKPFFNIFLIWCVKSTILLICILFNPLNAELSSIRHLLTLAGAHHFVDVSRIKANRIFVMIFTFIIFMLLFRTFIIVQWCNTRINGPFLLIHLIRTSWYVQL